MRIGVIISNLFKLPPKPREIIQGFSGAPEMIAWNLTEELAKRNHHISLFASGDSQTVAKLLSVHPKASALDNNIGISRYIDYEYYLIKEAISHSQEFDIIHSHIPRRTAIFASHFSCPVVTTLHSPLRETDGILIDNCNSQYYVSISNSQRKPLRQLNYIETVLHGLDIKKYKFASSVSNKMIFVGRIIPEKGLHTALKVAQILNQPLDIYGDIPEESTQYYQKEVQPLLREKDLWNGFKNQAIVQSGLRSSKMMIFPIQWEEPFGLVMIESMACGTPVVAFDRGSVREVVEDGKTGFIIKPGDIKAMVKSVQRIYDMSEKEYQKMRYNCRQHVEKNFTLEKMANNYERVYEKIINNRYR